MLSSIMSSNSCDKLVHCHRSNQLAAYPSHMGARQLYAGGTVPALSELVIAPVTCTHVTCVHRLQPTEDCAVRSEAHFAPHTASDVHDKCGEQVACGEQVGCKRTARIHSFLCGCHTKADCRTEVEQIQRSQD